jgi:hypothetical protein
MGERELEIKKTETKMNQVEDRVKINNNDND